MFKIKIIKRTIVLTKPSPIATTTTDAHSKIQLSPLPVPLTRVQKALKNVVIVQGIGKCAGKYSQS
jgi:hypothetical protein